MSITQTKDYGSILLDLIQKNCFDFHGKNSLYFSHAIHPFPAKFPPQLPKFFIENLTSPGEWVLDPMAGSGTTLLEAYLTNRNAIGVDIDPLAIKISKVKTSKIATDEIEMAYQEIINNIAHQQTETLLNTHKHRFDLDTLNFINYWFLPQTQLELLKLRLAIETVTEENTISRDFFDIVFSSTIITKTGGVSLARDLAHTRPHKDITKVPKDAILDFKHKFKKILKSYQDVPLSNSIVNVTSGDARNLDIKPSSIDLIVTSPPYAANAIDYMRAHKFSLVWLGEPINQLSDIRTTYIGHDAIVNVIDIDLPPAPSAMVNKLNEVDPKKAKALIKYLAEMQESLQEMYRVLKPGRCAIVVVGTSTMKGLVVETPQYLADIAAELGFNVAGLARRNIDRNKRMMPASFQKNGSQIEQRMHHEDCIALHKP